MGHDDSTEYLAALAVGAVLGIGAALLFRPRRDSRTQRIVRDLKPYGKRIRKGAARARDAVGDGASVAVERGGALADTSASVLRDFGDQLLAMAESARDEVSDMIASQLAEAREAVKHGAARIRG